MSAMTGKSVLLRGVVLLAVLGRILGCSNIIVTAGASADSSNILAYNADSASLYGSLYHYPAADHAQDEMRDIYDWDSGEYLGQIREAAHTYNVMGNTNEKGLIIGETTYGGIEELQSQKAAKMDYGSLIWVTLQRAATAREAITTLADLMTEYGYASEGESFSIADQKEAWVMEIIGKGEYELGAVWVAVKIPDGSVTAHANQARITTFPLNDPESAMYSSDVISFAKKLGLYDNTAKNADFSFSDVYDPISFSGARFCEARVWSFFGQIMGPAWAQEYLSYAQGYNLTNRMPLYVTPAVGGKISAAEVMGYMRSHYEGTDLDMSGEMFPDVGSADSHSIFRTHPLTWTSTINPATGTADGKTYNYLHERPIATPQTGWNFVAQSRRWMPAPFAALLWFGVDDAGTTVRFPVYGGNTMVPPAFAGKGKQDGVTPPMMEFSLDSAFYVFNLVANFAYPRWNHVYPDLVAKIEEIEGSFLQQVLEVDTKVLELIDLNNGDMTDAIEFTTQFSVNAGQQLVQSWTAFFGQLFVRYRDGYVITANSNSRSGCSITNAGYSQDWYDRIAAESKDHYSYEETAVYGKTKVPSKAINKLDLLARR
jgi:dipeptidase